MECTLHAQKRRIQEGQYYFTVIQSDKKDNWLQHQMNKTVNLIYSRHTHIHIYRYYLCVCTLHIRTQTYTGMQIPITVYTHIYTYTHTHTHMYIYVYMHMCACMHIHRTLRAIFIKCHCFTMKQNLKPKLSRQKLVARNQPICEYISILA